MAPYRCFFPHTYARSYTTLTHSIQQPIRSTRAPNQQFSRTHTSFLWLSIFDLDQYRNIKVFFFGLLYRYDIGTGAGAFFASFDLNSNYAKTRFFLNKVFGLCSQEKNLRSISQLTSSTWFSRLLNTLNISII